MNKVEYFFLKDLKTKIVKDIKYNELYQQKELLEILDISLNSFRKYFTSDKEWVEKAGLSYGQKKYFKGYYLREKISIIFSAAMADSYREDKIILNEIFEKYYPYLEVQISSDEDLEEIFEFDRYKKLFETQSEKDFWNQKLKEKIG